MGRYGRVRVLHVDVAIILGAPYFKFISFVSRAAGKYLVSYYEERFYRIYISWCLCFSYEYVIFVNYFPRSVTSFGILFRDDV